jgi:hypothetical protein
MFAFDEWADWLKSEADRLKSVGHSCRYSDNRRVAESASNPSFGIDTNTADRLGSLRYWKCGTCDLIVFDTASGHEIANEAGLDANNQTIATLFDRYKALAGLA